MPAFPLLHSLPCRAAPTPTSLPTARLQPWQLHAPLSAHGEKGWLLHSSWNKEELKCATSARCRVLPERGVTVTTLHHSTRASFAPRKMTPGLWYPVPSLPPPLPKRPLSAASLKGWTHLLMMHHFGHAFSSRVHFSGLTANPAPWQCTRVTVCAR